MRLNSFLHSAEAPRSVQGSCADFALCAPVRFAQLTQPPESTNHYCQKAESLFLFLFCLVSSSPRPAPYPTAYMSISMQSTTSPGDRDKQNTEQPGEDLVTSLPPSFSLLHPGTVEAQLVSVPGKWQVLPSRAEGENGDPTPHPLSGSLSSSKLLWGF